MSSERWQQIKELFHSALAVEAGRRAAFLQKACADDPSLREEVEALLASDERATDFIETPAVEIAAESLAIDGADLMKGRRIGPYQILREIGHGGMGVVYLAERADRQYRKRVAIKVIRRHMDGDSMFRRFRDEQQILANLDHPNIAKLLDGGTTEDGLSYFIMDHIEGLPMDLSCDTHKLPTEERLELFRAVCAAVQYAHQHDVLHCDLKPANFLVTAEGVPKLLDFGIAKLLNPHPSSQKNQSTTRLRPMTLGYASPEQVRGETITPASDVYSLGVVLYELLTGHRPYDVRSHAPQEMERMICEQQPEKPSVVIGCTETIPGPEGTPQITVTPESVSAVRDGQPQQLRRRLVGDLDNIVLMALRKEPERRYASVEQLSEDIRRHLDGHPVLARRDTLWYRSAKFFKRNQTAVVAAALTALILALVAMGLGLLTGRAQIDSIAVLPFATVGPDPTNANGDPNMEHLADGITLSLINSLSQLPKLRVVALSTVLRYKGQKIDPQRVGRDLKVHAVLMGRVLEPGDRVTIATELVDVVNGSHLWGEQYNRTFRDILAVQEEIPKEITEKLRLSLTGAERQRLARRQTENAAAYQEYLIGRHFWSERTAASLKRGLEHFERAIELDPRYAAAHGGVADSYVGFATFRVAVPKDAYLKARAAAVRALELDPDLSEAHSALAMVSLYLDWDWTAAEREFKRAIALNPGDATAHMRYALALPWFERFDEAIREIAQAREVDPISPLINANEGQILYLARRYDQAMEVYRRGVALEPTSFFNYAGLGFVYELTGAYDDAIAAYKKAIDLGAPSQVETDLAHAYAVSGQNAEARKILAQLIERSTHTYISPFDIAGVYAGLGDREQAFAWLERAYNEHARAMLGLKINQRLDPLRADPRFAVLMRRMKVFDAN